MLSCSPSVAASAAVVTNLFQTYFHMNSLPYDLLLVQSYESDHGPWVQAGVPSSGLFSGGLELKDPDQAARFGGQVNAPADPCYHQPCDMITNVNPVVRQAYHPSRFEVTFLYVMHRLMVCLDVVNSHF